MLSGAIKRLVAYGTETGLIPEDEKNYSINLLLDCFHEEDFDETDPMPETEDLEEILKILLDEAVNRGLITDSVVYRDLFDTRLMNCLVPRPAQVRRTFFEKYAVSPREATDYFYKLSQDSDYIRRYRIKKDIRWKTPSPYGDIDISINLSKPEKDPKAIAAARKAKTSSYPKCLLCAENEGYAGRVNHPARENHRIIPITINDSPWGFQYSPYVYYNEHCIVFNQIHTPMKIERNTFIGIVKWPLSVIRIRHADDRRLVELATHILEKWRGYTDEDAFIFAETDGEKHNTITPIARTRDGLFELDLALRNNITTEENPLGVYHPHAQYHHIKKENIGLIEVMGLAILPARLKEEMELLQEYILSGKDIASCPQLEKHAAWAEEFLPRYDHITEDTVGEILQHEIGQVFVHVLEDAGVFKCTAQGRDAFMRFVSIL